MDVALPTLRSSFPLDIIILFFYFIDYVTLRRFLATEKFMWNLNEDNLLIPFFKRRKIGFVIQRITDW